jgi:hypothetical protein
MAVDARGDRRLAQSASQGITEQGYEEQAQSYLNMSAAADMAASAEKKAAGGGGHRCRVQVRRRDPFARNGRAIRRSRRLSARPIRFRRLLRRGGRRITGEGSPALAPIAEKARPWGTHSQN